MAEQSIVRDAIARALTFINDYCRCAPSAVKARAIADLHTAWLHTEPTTETAPVEAQQENEA